MIRWLVLALLTTSVADAAPQTFRVLDWSRARVSQRMSTYTLVQNGKTATLDIATQTLSDGGPWKAESKTTWSGTVATRSGVTVLDFTSPTGALSYRCKPMTVAVARSTARRATFYRSEANGPYGKWSPAATTIISALFCTRTSGDGDTELMFATRAIEHVRADMDCCVRPGQSLRFVPDDRSVIPALSTP